MTKALLASALLLLGVATAGARRAADFFTSAPDRVMRLLPQATRLDMLDYHRYGSDRPSKNQFDGSAVLIDESDAVVSFQVDKDVTMQVAMLASPSDTVIALVTTLRLPVADSSLEFFSPDWKPMGKAPASMPAYSDWLTPEGASRADEVNVSLPFIPATASFNSDATVLTITNESPFFLEDEDTERLRPLVRDSITYDISGTRFRQRR